MEDAEQGQEVSTQYAVMVPVSTNPDDYIYVTDVEGTELKVRVFETEQKAITHASVWGKKAKVVEYIADEI